MTSPSGRFLDSEIASSGNGRSKSVSTSEVLFRNIVRGLYEGRYVPGQRLIEVDLSQEYKVSRFVVREALARLMAEGVVSTNFNRGAVIPRLSRKEASDIFLVMEKVFSLSASLAAENIDLPGNQALLSNSMAQLLEFTADDDFDFFEFGRASSLFFRSLVKISGNAQLQRVISALQVHLIRVQFRAYPSVAEVYRLNEFRKIGDAVSNGDAARAAREMSDYFVSLARDIAALPDRAFA